MDNPQQFPSPLALSRRERESIDRGFGTFYKLPDYSAAGGGVGSSAVAAFAVVAFFVRRFAGFFALFRAAFFFGAFLAAVAGRAVFARAVLGLAFRAGRRLGPWAARASSSFKASSNVNCSGTAPRGSEAFVVPSAT